MLPHALSFPWLATGVALSLSRQISAIELVQTIGPSIRPLVPKIQIQPTIEIIIGAVQEECCNDLCFFICDLSCKNSFTGRWNLEGFLLIQLGNGILGIAIAALGGAAVGVDRQRAYRENEPGAIGGLRTFALLGTVAGVCGFLISNALITLGVVILASTAAMVLIVRLGAGRIPRDATTEVAAMAGGVGPAGPGVCRYSLTCRNVLKWRPKLFPCRRPGKWRCQSLLPDIEKRLS